MFVRETKPINLKESVMSIRIIVRSFGSVFYFSAETRSAAELLRSCVMSASPAAIVEVYRGDTLLV